MMRLIEQAIERFPGLDRVGSVATTALHHALHGRPGRGRPSRARHLRRKLANLLHGVWLRHPLHPVLTDMTIGAWSLGAAFDIVAHITGSQRARWTGDRLNEIGTAAAVPTAITGMTEYASAPKPAVKAATLHGLLNAVTFTLCLASIWQRRRGAHPRAYALSWTAQGIMVASAWVGGMLVYRHRVGVDHSDRFTGPDDWTHVLDDYDLPERTPRTVEIEGHRVLVYREDGRVYAIGAVCAHAGGALEEGAFEEGCVRCPLHGSVYDLRTGGVVYSPSTHPQPCFDVRIHQGRVELRLSRDAEPRAAVPGRVLLGAR